MDSSRHCSYIQWDESIGHIFNVKDVLCWWVATLCKHQTFTLILVFTWRSVCGRDYALEVKYILLSILKAKHTYVCQWHTKAYQMMSFYMMCPPGYMWYLLVVLVGVLGCSHALEMPLLLILSLRKKLSDNDLFSSMQLLVNEVWRKILKWKTYQPQHRSWWLRRSLLFSYYVW